MKIYDEDENEHSFEKLQEDTQIMTIIEVQGIKCSARNFQVEFEIKQILIMKENVPNIFEKCILKTNVVKQTDKSHSTEKPAENCFSPHPEDWHPHELETRNLGIVQNTDYLPTDMLEINLDIDTVNNNETITLKKRDQVYYEMYKEARKKAKIIKKLAISSYLEAKRIKNTYMLTEIEDSEDSDCENEEDDEMKM